MATITAIGHEVLFVLPLGARGFVHVHAHVFHVCLGFSPPIIVEKEVWSDFGVLKESIFQSRYNDHEGFIDFFMHATIEFAVSP